MDIVTKNLSDYVRSKGINLSKMSRETGIPYVALYRSLTGSRAIRGDELLKICGYLEVDPMLFENSKEDSV